MISARRDSGLGIEFWDGTARGRRDRVSHETKGWERDGGCSGGFVVHKSAQNLKEKFEMVAIRFSIKGRG